MKRIHKAKCRCGRIYDCRCDSKMDHQIFYCRECQGLRIVPLLPAKPRYPPKPWKPEVNIGPYQHARAKP